MSGTALPEYLDLHRLAEQGVVLSGRVPARAMRRLAGGMADEQGEAEAELRFALDPARRPVIHGSVRAQVGLECQRCLQAYWQPLSVDFHLVRVRSESEGERLPEQFEPLLTEHGQVRTADLIEDELILALPIVAMHADEEDCLVQAGEQSATSEPAGPREPNAFAALAALKRKND